MHSAVVASAAAVLICLAPGTGWADPVRSHVHHVHRLAPTPSSKRHLAAIYRRGEEIVAPGGFAAHGYGYPLASAEERRDLREEDFRLGRTEFGFGFDGLGGTAFANDRALGFDGADEVP